MKIWLPGSIDFAQQLPVIIQGITMKTSNAKSFTPCNSMLMRARLHVVMFFPDHAVSFTDTAGTEPFMHIQQQRAGTAGKIEHALELLFGASAGIIGCQV